MNKKEMRSGKLRVIVTKQVELRGTVETDWSGDGAIGKFKQRHKSTRNKPRRRGHGR
jgi:hypothetical protein